ncbi:MAG: sporulation transcriptional regulator SpoIIID [Clostridia bacterium]|nr:sporulation transcriptional regulator SpoIIID [Clostridia bacterium]
MRDYSDQIIVSIANYILENKCTVRQCAQVFGISKSAIHSYVNTKLKYIDIDLYEDVRKVLEYNLSVRHLRGGESTKKLYQQKNKNSVKKI